MTLFNFFINFRAVTLYCSLVKIIRTSFQETPLCSKANCPEWSLFAFAVVLPHIVMFKYKRAQICWFFVFPLLTTNLCGLNIFQQKKKWLVRCSGSRQDNKDKRETKKPYRLHVTALYCYHANQHIPAPLSVYQKFIKKIWIVRSYKDLSSYRIRSWIKNSCNEEKIKKTEANLYLNSEPPITCWFLFFSRYIDFCQAQILYIYDGSVR